MDKGNTKQEILEAALDLFSVQGYEATSISQIADAVGIRKASLYSHFGSKQEILDTLKKVVLAQYAAHSLIALEEIERVPCARTPSPGEAVRLIEEQILYILHDPHVRKARKMLVIEQFQNEDLAKLQTKQNYSDVMRYFTGLVERLIRQGVLAQGDPEIMAAQLCLPISAWINLCDREPERESDVMQLVERHVRQFFRIYAAGGAVRCGEEGAILETDRLLLREMRPEDYDALYAVLADSDIMKHYPYSFDEARVRGWIDRNIERYRVFGFGLWAVCLRDTGEMIGDCGLTMQNIGGTIKPEIGYHIRRDMQRRGYAKEAASAVRDWAFENTPFQEVFSYMKYTNEPSARTAQSWGCHLVDEFADEVNEITRVFALTREEWLALRAKPKKENTLGGSVSA